MSSQDSYSACGELSLTKIVLSAEYYHEVASLYPMIRWEGYSVKTVKDNVSID